jgi:predicted ArsR family transcriptional regulator
VGGLLDESPMLNTSQIAAKLGMSYLLAREHLEFLENADLLTHVKFGKRIRFYKFKESAKATTVKNLIEAWRDT